MAVSQGDDRVVEVSYTLKGTDPAIVTVDFLTNGVTIGDANFANVGGDVNRIIRPDDEKTFRIFWKADRGWTGHVHAPFTADVRVWSLTNPPDYMVCDFSVRMNKEKNTRFYTSVDALPYGGLTNQQKYACESMVFRRVHAAGQTARLGSQLASTWRSDAAPSYLATFTEDYYLGIYPLTIGQSKYFWGCPMQEPGRDQTRWQDVTKRFTPCTHVSVSDLRGGDKGLAWPNGDDPHAIDDTVTWGTSTLSTGVSKLREYTGLSKADLPTRAQWEYAARAGSSFNYPELEGYGVFDDLQSFSDDPAKNAYAMAMGWTLAQANATGDRGWHDVGLLAPNKWGFYDMLGLVNEVVLDRAGDLDYANQAVTDPAGPTSGDKAVAMGGYILAWPQACAVWSADTSSNRNAGRNSLWGTRFCAPVDVTCLAE